MDTSLPGPRVVRVLERLRQERGVPERIQVDNGPEFISQVVDQWAHERGVKLNFIRPGKPTDNGRIESFNGKFRDECLNQRVATVSVVLTVGSSQGGIPTDRKALSIATKLCEFGVD